MGAHQLTHSRVLTHIVLLSLGIKLMQIVSSLYGVAIPKHNPNPRMRPHSLDNIALAFQMIETAKIKTNFLKSTHLIDHDLKMILGLLWAIILVSFYFITLLYLLSIT